jgi:DNA repair photolyase
MVTVRCCTDRPLLQACPLEGHALQLDPYVGCEHRCAYCYAIHHAETDWAAEILVHRDFRARLGAEIARHPPQPIYLGWNTDPYQPAEATHGQTRAAIEILADAGWTPCVLTKSDLVVRDIDLLARIPDASVGISLALDDEGLRALLEPGPPPNGRRVEALRRVREAGVATYALVCPVIPFLTDVAAIVASVAPWADSVYVYRLAVGSEADRSWLGLRAVLERERPDLIALIASIVFAPDHPYWAGVERSVESLRPRTACRIENRLRC